MAAGRMFSFRCDPDAARVLESAAEGAGVAVGALIREAALRAAVDVAREVRAGRLTLRGANAGARPELLPADAPVVDERGMELPVVPVSVSRADAFRAAAARRGAR